MPDAVVRNAAIELLSGNPVQADTGSLQIAFRSVGLPHAGSISVLNPDPASQFLFDLQLEARSDPERETELGDPVPLFEKICQVHSPTVRTWHLYNCRVVLALCAK
ncbi:MAG: hypothetical protein AAGF73_11140 [Actinomycetota bacterium]